MTQQTHRYSVALILLSMALAACVHSKGLQDALGVDDLLKSARTVEDTEVEVRGFLRFGDDTQNLWSSKEAYSAVSGHYVPPDSPLWNHCISLFDTLTLRADLLKYDAFNVVVRGRLKRYRQDNGGITFESCSDVGISVSSVTLAKSIPRGPHRG
jgi:hypothetical protein